MFQNLWRTLYNTPVFFVQRISSIWYYQEFHDRYITLLSMESRLKTWHRRSVGKTRITIHEPWSILSLQPNVTGTQDIPTQTNPVGALSRWIEFPNDKISVFLAVFWLFENRSKLQGNVYPLKEHIYHKQKCFLITSWKRVYLISNKIRMLSNFRMPVKFIDLADKGGFYGNQYEY